MKPIHIHTIEQHEHRYPTIGDYWETPESIEVRVTNLGNEELERLIVSHELVEIFDMQHRGIRLADSDDFDIIFEWERDSGKHSQEDEPGDDPRCPYRTPHRFAENIERQLCHEWGIDWLEYEAHVMKIWNQRPTSTTSATSE